MTSVRDALRVALEHARAISCAVRDGAEVCMSGPAHPAMVNWVGSASAPPPERARALYLAGDLDAADVLLAESSTPEAFGFRGRIARLRGDNDGAARHYLRAARASLFVWPDVRAERCALSAAMCSLELAAELDLAVGHAPRGESVAHRRARCIEAIAYRDWADAWELARGIEDPVLEAVSASGLGVDARESLCRVRPDDSWPLVAARQAFVVSAYWRHEGDVDQSLFWRRRAATIDLPRETRVALRTRAEDLLARCSAAGQLVV